MKDISNNKPVFLLVLGLFISNYWIGILNYILKSFVADMFCDDQSNCIKIRKKSVKFKSVSVYGETLDEITRIYTLKK